MHLYFRVYSTATSNARMGDYDVDVVAEEGCAPPQSHKLDDDRQSLRSRRSRPVQTLNERVWPSRRRTPEQILPSFSSNPLAVSLASSTLLAPLPQRLRPDGRSIGLTEHDRPEHDGALLSHVVDADSHLRLGVSSIAAPPTLLQHPSALALPQDAMQSLPDGQESSKGNYPNMAERDRETMADERAMTGAGPSQLPFLIPPPGVDDLLAAVRPFLPIPGQDDTVTAHIPKQPRLPEDVPTLGTVRILGQEEPYRQEGPSSRDAVLGEGVEESERTVAPAIDLQDASGLQVLETQRTGPRPIGLNRDAEDVDVAVMNRAELAADEVRVDAGPTFPTTAPMRQGIISQEETGVLTPLRLRVRTGQDLPNSSEQMATTSPENGGRGGVDGPSTQSTPQVYQGRRSFQLSQTYLPSPVNEPTYAKTTLSRSDTTRPLGDPSSSAPHELDADAYVITNYYPSDESQPTSENGNPSQGDNYPLQHRLSQRRGGSKERPVALSSEERPWRHSDSMTRQESRPIQPDGVYAPPADGRSSWYRANSPTTSPAVARAHRLSLPPTVSRGPSDGERSVSSGHGTVTGSSSTRSERVQDNQTPHEVDGEAARPISESPASSPLAAAGRQRPLSYHDGQVAESERPAVGPRQRSRLFGLRTFLHHTPAESSNGDQLAQAPALPRRDSRRARRDGSEREYHSVPQANRPRRSSRSDSDEQRAMMSIHSYPSASSHVATRNGLSLEETNLYTPHPTASSQRTPEHPTRPAPVPAQMASPPRRQSSEDSRGSSHHFMARRDSSSFEPTMSGALSRERTISGSSGAPSIPRYGRRDLLVSPARSYEQNRPRNFPSIHEDQEVYVGDGPGPGPVRTDLAYSPDGQINVNVNHSYSTGSQQTFPHSRRTSTIQRNPSSSQWTGISSAARWSERTTASSVAGSQLVKMKTTTIPAALYQQALALKELPPPPPPSKTRAETHPLMEKRVVVGGGGLTAQPSVRGSTALA
ncbi:MAG: cis-Golgi t-SNARE syntaxin [Watsoniomyces obsoletus]|nr:MAG: cis-Golgi t-SNARE syntaxin [Watsoniomyces obsoletus]